MGKPMQYYERSHGPLHLEDEFTDRSYAITAAKNKRQQGHRVEVRKRGNKWQLWTDE